MTGCRDMDKKSKIPPKWRFSPICVPPGFVIKNWALSLLYSYGALTSCKKLEKNNERSPLKHLKTDRKTDGQMDKGDYYRPNRVNPRSKISDQYLKD